MNKCTSEVENVNKSCLCKTLDKEVLFKVLGDSPLLKDLIQERPNLFSNVAIFLSQEEVKQIQNTIFAIEEIIQGPAFQKKVLENTSEVARMDFGTKGVFMGYDFHLTEDGPKLIEINTNAGGAFLNLILAKAQHSCCSGAVFPIELDKVQDSLFDIFMKEWRLQRKDQSLKVIAIMDENPTEQYLYPEFELFSKLFKEKGINIFILDPRLIEHKEGALWFENTKIDLIYNRSTDFYFENGVYSKIRDAYLGNEVVITPNPHHHALYADKENLEIFTSADNNKKVDESKKMPFSRFSERLRISYFGILTSPPLKDMSRGQWNNAAIAPSMGLEGSNDHSNHDTWPTNLWNQISFNYNYGYKLNFVVNPRFTIPLVSPVSMKSPEDKSQIVLEDAFVGFQGVVKTSENKKFNLFLRFGERLPISRLSRNSNNAGFGKISKQIEFSYNPTYDLSPKWQISMIGVVRQWVYEDRYPMLDSNVFYRKSDEERAEFRRKFNLPNKIVVALVTSGNFKKRGLDRFIDAIKSLPDHIREMADFRVVGKDRVSTDYHYLTFDGEMEDIQNYYNAIDIFVLPAYIEEFGRVVIEAMGCGLPVITTSTVGASEILVDEGRRFILSPFTTDSFSSALKDLILSKELREDIGRVNSRAVSFSLEQQRSKLNVILNKMENIY